MLFVDEKRLQQILLNLLSNAIKFTKKGQIIIYVRKGSPSSLQGDSVEFRVSDTGQGIKREDLPKLFNRFEILEYSQARHMGTGLGLSISKQLVEIMGGLMGVESEYGIGSTFWFQLPVVDPNLQDMTHTHEVPEVSITNPKALPHKILAFLENEIILGHLIETLNEDYNLNVESCATLEGLNIALKLYASSSLDKYNSISIIAEVNDIKLVDLNSLGAISGKGAYLHVVGVALDFADMLSQDFSSYPFQVDVVQKPLRITSLVELLLNKGERGIPKVIPFNTGPKGVLPISVVREKLTKSTVLVVEDNKVNQRVLELMLEKCDFPFKIVENGQEGVEEFKRARYFAILMDLQMPVMDGYTATKKIRSLENALKLSRTPIIALTANASESDKQKCIDVGMDDFISKPIQLDILKHKLQHTLLLPNASQK